MKTYFIVGRGAESLRKPSPSPVPQETNLTQQQNADFIPSSAAPSLKRIAASGKSETETPLLPWNNDDLRHIDSSEIESDANVIGSGGLKASLQVRIYVYASPRDRLHSRIVYSGHHR